MISEKHRTRNQTITLRVTPSERELFLRGAEKRNMTLTDFLVSAALYKPSHAIKECKTERSAGRIAPSRVRPSRLCGCAGGAERVVSVAFSACKKGNDMNIQTEIKPCLADYPDALTVDEVIAILRVSRKTVYELIKDGRIKAVKVGRSHRIAKENLIEFLNPAAAHSNPGCVLSDNNREKVWTCEQQCGMLCVAQTA